MCSMFIWARKHDAHKSINLFEMAVPFIDIVMPKIALKEQSQCWFILILSCISRTCSINEDMDACSSVFPAASRPHLIHILPHIWNCAEGLGILKCQTQVQIFLRVDEIWVKGGHESEWGILIKTDLLSYVWWIHHGGFYWGRHWVLYCKRDSSP